MKLHACIVSYKRQALTQRTLESFLATVTVPYTCLVVDNGSPPNVVDWLNTLDVPVLLLDRNYFPAYAVNRGWEQAPADATLLMRSDNDTLWLPGWCDEMLDVFEDPAVGQYGPIAAADAGFLATRPRWPVGGNSVVRRSLYDQGLRYDEGAWGRGESDAYLLSTDVELLGYSYQLGTRPMIEYLSDGDLDYQAESHAARHLETMAIKGPRNYPSG